MADKYSEIKYKKRAFEVETWQEDADLLELVREILFSWFGINCMMGWLGHILGFSYSPLVLFLASFLLVFAFEMMLAYSSYDIHKWIYTGIGGFSLLFFLLPFSWDGLQGLFYDVSRKLAGRGIILFLQGQENDSAFDRTLAVILLACLLYLIAKLCSVSFHRTMPWLLLLLLMVEVRFGDGSGWIWMLAFVLWMLLKLITTVRAYLSLLLPVLVLTLIFGFLVGYDSRDGWSHPWEAFRYRENTRILPEGNLREAKAFGRGKQDMLTLQGDASGYFYLKGFVGTVYEKNQWLPGGETLDDFEAGIVAGENTFLNWLHEKGYSGWNALADRNKELKENKENYVEVHNVGADRKYLYLPYELTTRIHQLEDDKTGVTSSGESLRATGIFGKDRYHYKMLPSLAGQEIIGSSNRDEKKDEYDAYEEYVYRTCLTLPKETKESLKNLMEGNSSLLEGDAMAIVARVRSWLSKHAEYNENPKPVPENEDFSRWFFEKNPEGYDVQYASAAVMLFRYYGIPSRYVEGYLVEDTNRITAESAHAWPEIYLPGKGWIPVEIMESYRGRMPSYLPEKGETIKTTDPEYGEKEEESTQTQEEEQTKETMDTNESTEIQEETSKQDGVKDGENGGGQDSEEAEGDHAGFLGNGPFSGRMTFALIVLLLIIMLLLFTYLFFRIRESRNWHRRTQSSSPGRSVEMWYRQCIWMIYLLESNPAVKKDMARDNRLLHWEERWVEQHPQVSKEMLRKAGLIRQKAIYRRRGIDWDEAKECIAFFQKESNYFYQELKGLDRLRIPLGLRPPFLKRIFRQ